MDIINFLTDVANDITNKKVKNSITPAIVGGKFAELANLTKDSLEATQGASAYQLAVTNGYVGTVEQWLASLTGVSAYQFALNNGYVGTEVQWLNSLKGINGTNGIDGSSAYTIAVENGFVGNEVNWLLSLHGESAYATAVDNGYVGTETQWLASLHGTNGINGDSAYTIAVQQGFSGDQNAWLQSLHGINGTNGISAYQVAVNNGFVGDITTWLLSLHGTNGLNGASAYESAVSDGYVGSITDWLNSLHGTNGTNGISAYQIAVNNGFVGDQAAWLLSLKGSDGETGPVGPIERSASLVENGTDAFTTGGAYSLNEIISTTYQSVSEKDQANGYPGLGTDGKIDISLLPDSIKGGSIFKGTYNGTIVTSDDVSLNGQVLPAATAVLLGSYFIITESFTLNTVNYAIGDWILSNGSSGYVKVQNSNDVSSVFGRSGNIIANQDDYSDYYPLKSDLTTETERATNAEATKVDKVTGFGLSSNDFTNAEKTKLDSITGTNTGDQDLTNLVVKVTGKQLSTEDFTTADKNLLALQSGTNTGDQDLSGKVDKITGKSLILDTEITRLATVTNQNISNLVPTGRTITINNVTHDLSANVSFSISGGTASGSTSTFGSGLNTINGVVGLGVDYNTSPYTNGLLTTTTILAIGDLFDPAVIKSQLTIAQGSISAVSESENNLGASTLLVSSSGGISSSYLASNSPDFGVAKTLTQTTSGYSFADFTFTGSISGASGIKMTIGSNEADTTRKVGMIVVDSIQNKGFEYDADYSANFTDLSLVTKQYVDAHAVSGGTGVTPINLYKRISSTSGETQFTYSELVGNQVYDIIRGGFVVEILYTMPSSLLEDQVYYNITTGTITFGVAFTTTSELVRILYYTTTTTPTDNGYAEDGYVEDGYVENTNTTDSYAEDGYDEDGYTE